MSLLEQVASRRAWTLDALCAGAATRDRDWWSPEESLTPSEAGFQTYLARRICAQCPVRTQCLVEELEALPDQQPGSMRGGLTPSEQLQLAKELGLRCRPRAVHGSRSRYVAGCRCDDCRNAHRVYEHERRLWAKAPTRVQHIDATSPTRVKRVVRMTPQGAVSGRLGTHGRTARNIATALGMKTRLVRRYLQSLEAGGRAAVVGTNADGAPLWARASAVVGAADRGRP